MNKTLKNLWCQKVFAMLWTLCLSLVLLNGCSSADDALSNVSTTTGVLSSSEAAREYAFDEDDFALRSDTLTFADDVAVHVRVDVVSDAIPAYAGIDVIELNNNIPDFTDIEKAYAPFEFYGDLDELGRCTVAFALAGPETMPTEKRGDIREVYPSGWEQAFYDFVDQEALYNRTHLIGYMLTAENANERNLITGTRHMNAEVMLPYEEAVANYIDETGNHVLYRVTPYFVGDELVARGIQMEAFSVEDDGSGICFNIFCYNVEPGVEIDYATGDSWLADERDASRSPETSTSDSKNAETSNASRSNVSRDTGKSNGRTSSAQSQDESAASKQSAAKSKPTTTDEVNTTYILNTNTGKFHKLDCSSVSDITPDNLQDYEGSREALLAEGYSPCGSCKP